VDDVFEESLANHELATKHGATCDGWGAAIVK
jgi:hypothetical protein